MKNFTINHFLIAVIALFSGGNAIAADQVCNQFDYFYADITAPGGVKQTDIYSVSFVGSDAILSALSEDVPYGAHIAYNDIEKLLYVVNEDDGSIQTYDPNTNDWSTVIAPSMILSHITGASISPNGKLLLGNQNDNVIYQANFSTDPYTVTIYDNVDNYISGGDLVFTNTGLFLATKPSGYFYVVYPGMANHLIGQVDGKVTGLAKAKDGETVMLSAQGNTSFLQYNIDLPGVAVSQINEYNALLNGEPFTLGNGDMASGCSSSELIVEECANYKLYYMHHPQGGGDKPLLEVTLNNDGTASYTTIVPHFGGHIGITPDGSIIYATTSNKLRTFDVASSSVTANVVIKDAGGTALGGFVALVVSHDGTIYAGQSSSDQVFTIDPNTGIAIPFGPNRPVSGGDLVELDGEIWLINRFYNSFTNVLTGDSFTVPVTQMNGAAVLGNGNVLVADGNGESLMKEIDPLTHEVVATYDIGFPLNGGDLAGVCVVNEPAIIGCYGFEVLDFVQGLKTNGQPVPADRSNPAAALGEPDRSNAAGGFVSLGVGGYITIGFSGFVMNEPGNDIKIWETSFSGNVCGGSDDEYADIELSQDGVNFVSVGTICRNGEVDMADAGLSYVVAIRITNSSLTGTPDGYDVDGVEAIHGCSSFPVIETGECYATEVVEHVQGTSKNGGAIATNRTDATKALGEPERIDQLVFVSLGYGGSLTLAFDGSIPNGPGNDIEIVETSWGTTSCAAYPEYADVYVSVNGTDWFLAGTVCKFDPFVDISDTGENLPYVNFVKVVNNNTMTTTPDGFDVDGVVALHNCIDEVTEEDETPPTNPFTVGESNTLLTTFPNPTKGPAKVVFTSETTTRTLIEVYDMNGRNVATLFNSEAQKGKEYTLDFDGTKLSNGIYVVRFNDGDNVIFNKIMIAK